MSYVLIVDDDHSAAASLADIVGLFGFTTQTVHSPRSAIQTIHNEVPSLIFLDMNMPGVDGLEVCRYIKRDPISLNVPVVFISAEDDPTVIQSAKDAGASGYLVKPIDIDKLEELVTRVTS